MKLIASTVIAGLFLTLNVFMANTSMPQALWMQAQGLVMHQTLNATLVTPDEALQTSLEAWSDPHDYAEALYVHAPDGSCAVSLDQAKHVITITLCEI